MNDKKPFLYQYFKISEARKFGQIKYPFPNKIMSVSKNKIL